MTAIATTKIFYRPSGMTSIWFDWSTTMSDTRIERKQVMLRLLGSPLTMMPFVAGMTVMAAGWALQWQAGVAAFSALAGVLGTAGVFSTRLLMSGDRVAAEVAAEYAEREKAERTRALDDLDHRLRTTDQDERTETALRDLRTLLEAFDDAVGQESRTNPGMVEIQSMVSRLFDQCVHSLEETLQLWETAEKLNAKTARKPILKQRESVVREIQDSIAQLSRMLTELQGLQSTPNSTAELSRIRGELDDSLLVAKRVDERLQSLLERPDEFDFSVKPERKTRKEA